MAASDLGKRDIEKLLDPYRVTKPDRFKLSDVDPADTQGMKPSKKEARALLAGSVKSLSKLQEMLYAQDRWAVLVVLQAMDAAGKDGVVKHVMSGVNPQGVDVTAFKAPSSAELQHDYLWRCQAAMPQRGRIGIFNRSYYEEVLIARVHPDVLKAEKLPKRLVTKKIWRQRFDDINAYERYLTHNGIAVCKFFLHLSKDEQRRRFLARLEDADRQWKFSGDDIRERAFWDDYQFAYQETIKATSTDYAPWYAVPADNKWFTRYVVAEAIVAKLNELKLAYPKVDPAQREDLEAAARDLRAEDS